MSLKNLKYLSPKLMYSRHASVDRENHHRSFWFCLRFFTHIIYLPIAEQIVAEQIVWTGVGSCQSTES